MRWPFLIHFLLSIDKATKITFPEVIDDSESSESFSTGTKHPYYSHNNVAAKQIQRLCPSVDTTSLQSKGNLDCQLLEILNSVKNFFKCLIIKIKLFIDFTGFDQHEDLLLIVTFYRKEYDSIPLLEILYRPHFKVSNIISNDILA